MAAFETLMRYQAEWEGYAQVQDARQLLEATRFVAAEFEKTDRRTTAQSWMDLPVKTLHDVARQYKDSPRRATKSELADYLAGKTRETSAMHRQQIQEKVRSLETGTIPDGLVQFLITALDTYIW